MLQTIDDAIRDGFLPAAPRKEGCKGCEYLPVCGPYEEERVKEKSQPELKRLKEEHAGSVVPLQTLASEARTLEGRVSDLVNAAYGLTPEEIALMWKTAPPRMPVVGPTT